MKDEAEKLLGAMTPEEIKAAVAAKYSQVATTPAAHFNFPVGRALAESVGYPPEALGYRFRDGPCRVTRGVFGGNSEGTPSDQFSTLRNQRRPDGGGSQEARHH